MAATPTSSSKKPQIFPSPLKDTGSPSKQGDKLVHGHLRTVCKEPMKLTRLVKLHYALPKAPLRQKVLEQLREIWTQVQKDLAAPLRPEDLRPEEAAANARKHLDGMTCRHVARIYTDELDKPGPIFEKAKQFLKDVDSVPCCPVTRSTKGNKGPTFITSYPSLKGRRKHVIKWSHLNELMSNSLYRGFSTCFAPDVSCGFLVPKSARVDFRSCFHESASGIVTRFNETFRDSLRASYTDLARAVDSRLDPQADHLMFADLVRGQNMLDFSYSEYDNLSVERKLKFFERLGRLAMLDLVFGNPDRLVQVNLDSEGQYCLDNSLEVNLGNVMIANSQDPLLYAIDNGVDPELIESTSQREKYLEFLNKLFSEDDPYLHMTQNFVSCFLNALSSQVDDVEYMQVTEEKGETTVKADLSVLRKKMQTMVKDLKQPETQQAIHKGMCKMSGWLRETVVPSIWPKNGQAIALQVYLKRFYPNYLEAIQERLFAFAKLSEVR